MVIVKSYSFDNSAALRTMDSMNLFAFLFCTSNRISYKYSIFVFIIKSSIKVMNSVGDLKQIELLPPTGTS